MKPQLILDMPAEEYHALDALSATGIKMLYSGVLDFYHYKYGKGAESEQTAAMRLGSAKHMAGLEGLEAFRKAYVPAIDKRDYNSVLDSQEELKGWCRDHGLAVGGSKSVLCDRIINALDAFDDEGRPTLWMDQVNHQKDTARDNGQEILTQDEYKDALSKAKQIAPIVDAMRDAGGLPEVSILFEHGGIPCKARLDFLAPAIAFDLKNVQNSQRMPFGDLVSKTMANMLMVIQAEFYLMAVRAAQAAGLLPFKYDGDWRFAWLFLQSAGTPNMCMRTHIEKQKSMDTGQIEQTMASLKGQKLIGQGMHLYQQYMKSHGTDSPWIPELDDQEMTDIMYPFWFLNDMDDAEVEL